MEWLLGGSLPPGWTGGGAGGGAARSGAARSGAARSGAAAGGAEAALDRAGAELARQKAARERERVERERAAELERVRRGGSAAWASLAEQEAALRAREGALKRELPAAEPATPPQGAPMSLAERLRQGVAKTRERLANGLGNIVQGRKELDRDALEELEELLLTADMGPQTATRLIKALESKLRRNELKDPQRLQQALRAEVEAVLSRHYDPPALDGKRPAVILFAGVNGTGKTTTIGKLAARYTGEGRTVILAAADTFRAAAIEQLRIWADRAGVPVVAHAPGADPGAVVYDALDAAVARGSDIVIADTAGRLHTKSNLMDELSKVRRIVDKRLPGAAPETLFVLDATTGQNGLAQARAFHEAVGLTGIVLTKLDSTSKGGIVFAIEDSLGVPVRFVGVGEKVGDLVPFDPDAFVAALFA
jgi:fused signal recognition particle receptor